MALETRRRDLPPPVRGARLEIGYDYTAYMATCEITLTGETIGTVAQTSQERRQRWPANHPVRKSSRSR
jgi:hypothetical protein